MLLLLTFVGVENMPYGKFSYEKSQPSGIGTNDIFASFENTERLCPPTVYFNKSGWGKCGAGERSSFSSLSHSA